MQRRRELTWNPHDLGWRVAVLFMTGAFIFALGSFPLYSQNIDPGAVGITFVVGSIIFTSAAYSSFVQMINDGDSANGSDHFRYWAWQPSRTLWWAAIVQLVGTLFFNATTIDAMIDGLSTEQTDVLVWAPDFFGSACFLIASHLAWLYVCGRLWCVRRDDADWWGALINYAGSILFMFSGIAAFTLPTTGDELNTTIVNFGTFAGAICFFVGAYLLLPAASAPSDARADSAAS
jgi:hypothetical protein